MIAWRTTWLLLCLNLEHMCGLQFPVQAPHGGELARDRVDADGTVLVQDGVSKGGGQGEVSMKGTGIFFSPQNMQKKKKNQKSAPLFHITSCDKVSSPLWLVEI